MKPSTFVTLIFLFLLTPPLFGQTNAPADSTNAAPAITNTVTPFQQAVAKYQQSPNYFSDAERVAKLAAAMDTLPPLPAEARKHFVMGQTIFKDATSTNDFQQAFTEFYQASTNAPWMANIWFNMATAAESEGRYDLATNSLQVYQDFKISAEDAQKAQDKIYEIQAKQEMAAKKQVGTPALDAAEQNDQNILDLQRNFPDLIHRLEGATFICRDTDGTPYERSYLKKPFDDSVGNKYKTTLYLWEQEYFPNSDKYSRAVVVIPTSANSFWLTGIFDPKNIGDISAKVGKQYIMTLSQDGQTLTQTYYDNGQRRVDYFTRKQ